MNKRILLSTLLLLACQGELPDAPHRTEPPTWVRLEIPREPTHSTGSKPDNPTEELSPSSSDNTGTGPVEAAPQREGANTENKEPQEAERAPAPPEAAPHHSETRKEEPWPKRVVAWQAFQHTDEWEIQTQSPWRLREEGLKDVSYLHPFVLTQASWTSLVRRVIAVDPKPANYDMRDAVLLPVSSRWSMPIPAGDDLRLEFSHCVVEGAFSGKSAKVSTLKLQWSEANGGQPTSREINIDLRSTDELRRWTDHSLALGKSFPGGSLEVSLEGALETSQAIAVANLRLSTPLPRPATAGTAESGGTSPNVLIVFIDAARGDSVGPANKAFPSVTPFLDELASRGTAFAEAYSVSNQTRPSITGFLQGQPPTAGGYHSRFWFLGESQVKDYYASHRPLLPRLLGSMGFVTASIGRNSFQYGVDRLGLDPGFATIWDNRVSQKDTVFIIDHAIEWLRSHQQDRFFLLVNISPPHQPYNPPEKYLQWTTERLKGIDNLPAAVEYLAELYYADQELARLFGQLEKLGLDSNTLVIVTADHGEVMHRSHSCQSEVFRTICHNSHGLTLYNEETHVPLIWVAPFLKEATPAGLRRNIVSHLDVVPTILDLLGMPGHPGLVGRSLRGDLLGEPAEDETIFQESRLSSSVRKGTWKLITHHRKDDARTPAWLSGPKDSVLELYDLDADPQETRNLAGKRTQRVHQLQEELSAMARAYRDKANSGVGASWPPQGTFRTRPEPPALEAVADAESASPEPQPASPEVQQVPSSPAAATATEPTPEDSSALLEKVESGKGEATEKPDTDQNPRSGLPRSGFVYVTLSGAREARQFRGEILVDGALTRVETLGGQACVTVPSTHSIALDCSVAGEGPRLRLQTDPPGAALEFHLAVDNAPMQSDQIYVGMFGLHLLEESGLLSHRDYGLSRSPRSPHFLPGFDVGIFLWNDVAGLSHRESDASGAAEEAFEAETIEDESARNVLKNLGYWQ